MCGRSLEYVRTRGVRESWVLHIVGRSVSLSLYTSRVDAAEGTRYRLNLLSAFSAIARRHASDGVPKISSPEAAQQTSTLGTLVHRVQADLLERRCPNLPAASRCTGRCYSLSTSDIESVCVGLGPRPPQRPAAATSRRIASGATRPTRDSPPPHHGQHRTSATPAARFCPGRGDTECRAVEREGAFLRRRRGGSRRRSRTRRRRQILSRSVSAAVSLARKRAARGRFAARA
eukprot:scaffold1991_cov357-Prasinococcus_capsulatus_cf.AAC.2